MADTKIILKEKIEAENPLLIEGFPGVGLIGNIVTQHIIKSNDYDKVGVIDSSDFPPVAMIYEGVVNLPIRIYNKGEFVVLTSDIPISSSASNEFAKKIIEWAKGINVRKIISIGGISTMREDKQRVFSTAYSKEELEDLSDETEVFSAGNISGVSGSILTQSKLNDLPAISLLGETKRNVPDPRAAAAVIEVLNKKFDLDVETKKLLEEAEKIEEQMKKLAERMKRAREGEEATAPSPMYR